MTGSSFYLSFRIIRKRYVAAA